MYDGLPQMQSFNVVASCNIISYISYISLGRAKGKGSNEAVKVK